MDFFERQEQARIRSLNLIPLFIIAIVGVIFGVYAVCVLVHVCFSGFIFFWQSALQEGVMGAESAGHFEPHWWRPELMKWIALVVCLLVFVCGWIRSRQLAAGGRVVAEFLGGRRANSISKNLNERRLINIVEEMSVASGIPVPDVYIFDREPGLNAFVTGFTVNDMVFGITGGALKYLTRDELQGIIAHEYSHIFNGDMRLKLKLMGWVHGLFCLTLFAEWVMTMTHPRETDLNAKAVRPHGLSIFRDLIILVIGFLITFIGWHGAFFGRMIKSAVSRQREYLADASAIQFTRYPEGLANALAHAHQWPEGGHFSHPRAEEASHIFFTDAMIGERFALTATHPPVEERIRRIRAMMGGAMQPPPVTGESEASDRARRFEGTPQAGPVAASSHAPVVTPKAVLAQNVIEQIGIPAAEHLQFAVRLIASLPDKVKAAAHESGPAELLVYALVLSKDEPLLSTQLALLNSKLGESTTAQVRGLFDALLHLDQSARIPLLEMALPALRQLSREQSKSLAEVCEAIAASDQHIDFFEFALRKMLQRHLPHLGRGEEEPRFFSLKPLTNNCSLLLSALAHAGHAAADAARKAFDAGVQSFRTTQLEFKFMSIEDCTLNTIGFALDDIAAAGPQIKKQIVEACAQTVASDGMIHPREGELLRAIADAVGCPMPPLVDVSQAMKQPQAGATGVAHAGVTHPTTS